MKPQNVRIGKYLVRKDRLNHEQKMFIRALEKAYDEAPESVGFQPDYSGRFMYGATCCGVSVRDASQFTWRRSEQSSDSLGLRVILYFRHIPGLQYGIQYIDEEAELEEREELKERSETCSCADLEKIKLQIEKINNLIQYFS